MPRLHLHLELVRARAGGDGFAFEPGPQRYLVRTPGGGFREIGFDWDDALLADLAAMAGARPSPAVAARLGERMRAFIHDTPLAAVEAQLAEGAPAWLTVRSAAAELYALPWELLALRPSGLWLGQLPELLLSHAWPEARARPADRGGEGGRLLFAWSEAGGPVPHAEQAAAIARAAEGVLSWSPEADSLSGASLAGLSAALNEARMAGRPFVALHLLAHGVAGPEGGSLILDGAAGPMRVDAAALRGALSPHLGALRLVVVAACQSASTGAPGGALGGAALALHRAGVEAVVGARQPLSLRSATQLTETLYTELLQRSNSVERAFLASRRAILERGDSAGGLQLWSHPEEGGDTRPFVLRPFRGLLAFEARDQRFFFGRDRERDALLRRVLDASEGRAPRFQVLCGATGSGKSSLVRAGLLPPLVERGWRIAFVRPASAPIASLDAALDALGPDDRLLIVVDPLQELFTAVAQPEERAAIAAALHEATQDPRVVLLAGVRVDYLGRCEEIHLDRGRLRLDTLVYDEAHRVFLAAPGPAQLRAAAVEPLARVGLAFEAGLLEVILADAGSEPGALPALQHALDRLWTLREGRLLTHQAYLGLGGISGALATSASEVLDRMSDEERPIARHLLVALVHLGKEGVLASRRQAQLDQLLPADVEARARAARVLELLVEARLVVLSRQGDAVGVEIAHEALLRRWDRLRAWVEEDADQHRRLEELRVGAESWERHRAEPDGGASYLLRGTRLGYAREILAGAQPPARVLAFVEASVEAEAQVARQRLADLSERERLAKEAMDAATRARDAALLASARAWREADPTLSLQLLRAVRGADQPLDWMQEAFDVLGQPLCVSAWTLDEAPEAVRGLLSPARRAGALQVSSPDGERVATAGADGRVRVLDRQGAPLLTLRGHVGAILDLAWSADGRWLCSGSEDQTARVWEVETGSSTVFRGFSAPVTAARLAPDGERLAAGSKDGTLRVWERESGRELSRRDLGAAVCALAWGPSLLLGDAAGRVYTLGVEGAGHALAGHRGPILAVAWSADGLALSASEDGSARAWRLTPRQVAPLALPVALRRTGALDWSPGGDLLACGGVESMALLVRPDAPEQGPIALRGHKESVRALAWRADGSALLTGSNDDTARIWSAAGRCLAILHGHTSQILSVAWSAADLLASGDADGSVRLWSREGRLREDLCFRHDNEVRLLRFSRDGRWLLSHAADRTARLTPAGGGEGWTLGVSWTRASGASAGRAITAACWAEGRAILGSAAGELLEADPETRSVRVIGQVEGAISALAADGARVAASTGAGLVILCENAQSTTLVAAGAPATQQLLLASGGRLLLGLDVGGRTWVMDLRGARERVSLVTQGRALRMALASDGERLAVACDDGALRVWPLSTARTIALLTAASAAELDREQRRRYLGEP